jgi:hypothetical protein
MKTSWIIFLANFVSENELVVDSTVLLVFSRSYSRLFAFSMVLFALLGYFLVTNLATKSLVTKFEG